MDGEGLMRPCAEYNTYFEYYLLYTLILRKIQLSQDFRCERSMGPTGGAKTDE